MFDGDVPALPMDALPAGDTLHFALYDPRDEDYSARFRALMDWVAVPREERYLLALAPQGKEQAEAVLSGLTNRLLLSSFSEG